MWGDNMNSLIMKTITCSEVRMEDWTTKKKEKIEGNRDFFGPYVI